jgi:hypothetical protein
MDGVRRAASEGILTCDKDGMGTHLCVSSDVYSHLGPMGVVPACSRLPTGFFQELLRATLGEAPREKRYFESGPGLGLCARQAHLLGAEVYTCSRAPINPYLWPSAAFFDGRLGEVFTDSPVLTRLGYGDFDKPPRLLDEDLNRLVEQRVFEEKEVPFVHRQWVGPLESAFQDMGRGTMFDMVFDTCGNLEYERERFSRVRDDLYPRLTVSGAMFLKNVVAGDLCVSRLSFAPNAVKIFGNENIPWCGLRLCVLVVNPEHPWYQALKRQCANEESSYILKPSFQPLSGKGGLEEFLLGVVKSK